MSQILALGFRSRIFSAICVVVVILSFALPPQKGFGIPMCEFKVLTHYPCLGCGLTRSFIDMAHLHPLRAGFYHPFGWVLFPLTALFASLLPASEKLRTRLAEWAEQRAKYLNPLGIAFLVLFLAYGLGRIAWLATTHTPSPW